jgi:hypothetical protein
VGITVQWIKNGMKDSPQVMVDNIQNVVEGSMLDALKRS